LKTILSNLLYRVTCSCLVFLLMLIGSGASLAAQETTSSQDAQPSYQVGKISVKFLGTANVSEEVVRANMQVREGGVLDNSMIDQDIRALYRTGLFEFIEVKRETVSSYEFNLVVEVTPKFRVMAIRYQGNNKVRSARLEKEVKTRPNTALDERQINEDAEKIREYYQKAGYNQISVSYAIERDRASGFGTVIFNIRENTRAKIAKILFVGNDNVKDRKLRKEMETRKWWFLSWLTGTGRFKDDLFEEDLDKLRDYYREEGFLDVEILQEDISFDYPSQSQLVITIHLNEGRRYRIGDIEVTGSKIYQEALLKRVIRQKSGMIFTPSKLDKDVERLEDFYGTAGYLETRVRMLRKPNITSGNIDIEYKVSESEKFNVESINIEGNTKTKSIVILRELVLGPGDVYDTVREKISKLRLENTRFFDDVQLSPQETNIPGRRNLRVAVREARTGNLTFGAGFSSLEKATVFAELSQGNFDLFNRRSFFQGDGQKFRLRLQLGSLSSEALVSFEEPWLFERQLAVGFSIYRTSSDYNSQFYTQLSTGGEIFLRKRLFELVDGRLSYTYEIVEISDIAPSATTFINAQKNTVSRMGFQLVRDTRDKIIGTTSGNRVELTTDVAGGPFGGNVDYYKLEFRGAQYYPVFDFQAQVMSIIARAGIIDNYGESPSVPYYNRYYMGGPNTLRGFDFNDVGPRDVFGNLIGGKSYGMLSLEYSMDVVSPIRVAVFYDAGFVNLGAYDFNPADLHDNVGLGVQLFVAGAPLRLDYAIPLTRDSVTSKGGKFNFSFGTRF
jgi:outer membrane protein insertion porin family